MTTMRAVQADAIRRPMVLRDIAIPDIGEHDALVRVVASGICRTDWHVWNGDWTWAGLDLPLPITLGHEIGGVVERVGSAVTNLKPGMKVCVPFNFADGTCPYCQRGKQNLCENAAWNFTTPGSGGCAEYARVPNAQLNCIPLPGNVTERDGAALGCRYMTAYRAVRSRANVRPGETVLVIGVGGVGRSAVQIATAMGGLVIAVDSKPSALEAAKKLGAIAVVNSADLEPEDIAKRVKEANGGLGVEVAIDAMGGHVTTPAAMNALAKGGRLVVAGLTTQDDRGDIIIPVDQLVLSEWSVMGTLGNPHGDYGDLLQLVDSGRLQPSKLIGEEVALRDVRSVFDRLPKFETEGFTVITNFN